jgi:predicted alpha/beta-hydrolase family hydrolase
VTGGRSSGARVACRTAEETGAAAVLLLAFPLEPPRSGRTRLPELLAPRVPRLVVQGARDAFGVPTTAPGVQVHVVAGADHAFAVRRKDGRAPAEVVAEVEGAVRDWLGAQTET